VSCRAIAISTLAADALAIRRAHEGTCLAARLPPDAYLI
jgi:hypothetical protein